MINMEASLDRSLSDKFELVYVFKFGKSELKLIKTGVHGSKQLFQVESITIDTEELRYLFTSRKKE